MVVELIYIELNKLIFNVIIISIFYWILMVIIFVFFLVIWNCMYKYFEKIFDF